MNLLLDDLCVQNPFPSWITAADVDPDKHAEQLAETIEEDPRLTAAVLRRVNSAVYGGVQCDSIEESIIRLGYTRVKEILMACFMEGFYHQHPVPKDKVVLCRNIFDHSIATGIYARALSPLINPDVRPTSAYTAGLLHHLGLYLLVCRMPVERTQAALIDDDWVKAEEFVTGTNHAETGGMILSMWNLPETITNAVAHHHNPVKGSAAEIVRAASIFANFPDDLGMACVEKYMPGFSWESVQHVAESVRESLKGLTGALHKLCPAI